MNITDLELLTPGSIWHSNKSQKVHRVIGLSNTEVSEKFLAASPQDVVCLVENNQLITIPVESFLRSRTFYNVDGALESAVEALSSISDEAMADRNAEELLTGAFTLEEAEIKNAADVLHVREEDTTSQIYKEVTSDDLTFGSNLLSFIPADDSTLPTALPADLLQQLVSSYEETPILNSGEVMSAIVFYADERYTKEQLINCFTSSPHHAVFILELLSPSGEVTTLDWTTFAGVYPAIINNELAYKVVLLSTAQLETVAPVDYVAPTVTQTVHVSVPTAGLATSTSTLDTTNAPFTIVDTSAPPTTSNVAGVVVS